MKAEIEITEVQLSALSRSLTSAFPDEATRPSLGEYITAGAQTKLNEHVEAWRQRDAQDLQQKVSQLPAEGIADLLKIVEKYQPAPAPTEA